MPDFRDFRSLMDVWDRNLIRIRENRAFLDQHGLVFYFEKDGKIYGAPELSRIQFAAVKSGEDPDASFSAFDLDDLKKGKETLLVFDKGDVKGIKVLDDSKVAHMLDEK